MIVNNNKKNSLFYYLPNFPTDAMESNLCSVWLMLSIISIPTAPLNLFNENTCNYYDTYLYSSLKFM